jgi:hypothetical protein
VAHWVVGPVDDVASRELKESLSGDRKLSFVWFWHSYKIVIHNINIHLNMNLLISLH